jgi:hypothetical protein
MRQRLIPVIAAFALALGVLAIAPASPASAACASNQIRVELFENSPGSGLYFDICTGSFKTDSHFGDSLTPVWNFNDKLSAVRIYAPPNNTACVILWDDINFSGNSHILRVPGGLSGMTYHWAPFSPNDTISSGKFSRYIGGNAACP